MNRAGKSREAVEYLEGCQRQCPAYECALVHLVRYAKEFYDRREYQLKLWNYAKACTVQPPVPYERGKDRQLVESELKQLEKSAELQRYLQDVANSARLRKVGLGLLIGGLALGIAGVTLGVVGETSYIPAAGSCSSPEGLSGDPCVLDYHGRPVYVPVLGAGIGLGITGALFMQKYKEKAPKSFWEAP